MSRCKTPGSTTVRGEILAGDDVARADRHTGVVKLEARQAQLVPVAQAVKLAGGEVLLKGLPGRFRAVDLDVANRENVAVRRGCVAVECDRHVQRHDVLPHGERAHRVHQQGGVAGRGRA